MFCENCGAKNEDGARFCESCGKPLVTGEMPDAMATEAGQASTADPTGAASFAESTGAASTASATNQTNGSFGTAQPASATGGKKPPKGILIGAVIGAIGVIAVAGIGIHIATAPPTIKLDKYMTVEASGYDGYGRASAYIDWDAIEEKYGKKLEFTESAENDYGSFLVSLTTPFETLKNCVGVDFDKDDHLSNGDEISYEWLIHDDAGKYLNAKLKYKDGTYKVSDLEEVSKFDAFDGLDVTFSGIAPNGEAKKRYTGIYMDEYDFSLDKSSRLKNGDTVTVTISDSSIEDSAENYGKVPETPTKTYTVEGLDEYVSSYSDIPEDIIAAMHTETEDEIYAYTAKYNAAKLSDLAYAGYILNVEKPDSGYSGDHNQLYVIYSGTVTPNNEKYEPLEVYYPVRFTNIIKTSDGYSYKKNDGIIGSSDLDNWGWTSGYANPLVCYMEIVDKYSDRFSAECGDGFELYASQSEITKLADISDSYKETLYANAKKYVREEYAGNSSYQVTEPDVLGEYMLINKNKEKDYSKNNRCIVVCSAVLSSTYNRFEPVTVYFPVEFDGVVKLSGDKYMITACNGIQGYTWFSNDGWQYSTKGYLDGSTMFSEVVTANRSNYTYEVSDGLKQFGE